MKEWENERHNDAPDLRHSKSRDVILEELKKLKSHPRGDELYQIVRQSLPRISLGTVYRNLDLLARQGTVLELLAGDFNRYDGNTSPHAHFLCRECHRLWDFAAEPVWKEVRAGTIGAGFRVESRHLFYHGLCPECQPVERDVTRQFTELYRSPLC